MDINDQIKNQLAKLETEVRQIGYGEFVKPPVLKVGGVEYTDYCIVEEADDGRALDGTMHRTKNRLVVNSKEVKSIIDGFNLPRAY